MNHFKTGSKSITDAGITDTTVANTKYTISNSGWHPYVEIEMTVSGGGKKTYKWATMNVGATEETGANSYGTYFSWAEVIGHTSSGDIFTFPSTNPDVTRYTGTWNAASCFADCNTPYYGGSAYTKYTGTGMGKDGKTVLESADDAANANWGGSWRMPTEKEFDALSSLTSKEWTTNYNGSGVSGYLFSNSIFLPAAGYGDDTDLYFFGDCGNYWSSSLDAGHPTDAYCLYFYLDNDADTAGSSRYCGMSVRALSE